MNLTSQKTYSLRAPNPKNPPSQKKPQPKKTKSSGSKRVQESSDSSSPHHWCVFQGFLQASLHSHGVVCGVQNQSCGQSSRLPLDPNSCCGCVRYLSFLCFFSPCLCALPSLLQLDWGRRRVAHFQIEDPGFFFPMSVHSAEKS